ncbi:response regulator [Bosea vaviloviae]|uniref:Regulatory protein VirG n=1 Tax=Bosea vaviloviae TaxID=1526658 RepID=A0A0N1F497_9HYPH|nr:response regulator [Bosea vaviloviae]KPH78855.1 transcriptional regulator [Bosea vaviloviae]
MTRTPHILIVEDDREIATLVSRFLRNNDFRVRAVPNGREMDVALRDGRFDLIVLDLMLPGEDGLSLCRRLRNDGAMPIIMLTAKGEEIDRILGLEMGADDYLVKPFNPRELLARIRAVLRRAGSAPEPEAGESTVLAFSGWRLDKAVRRLFNPQGERVMLTGAELDLLLAFCERPRRVLSRDQLLDLTQGRAAAPFERSIDVLVSRLRQKMEANPREPELIQTIRSGGYMFSPEIQSSPEGETLPDSKSRPESARE